MIYIPHSLKIITVKEFEILPSLKVVSPQYQFAMTKKVAIPQLFYLICPEKKKSYM